MFSKNVEGIPNTGPFMDLLYPQKVELVSDACETKGAVYAGDSKTDDLKCIFNFYKYPFIVMFNRLKPTDYLCFKDANQEYLCDVNGEYIKSLLNIEAEDVGPNERQNAETQMREALRDLAQFGMAKQIPKTIKDTKKEYLESTQFTKYNSSVLDYLNNFSFQDTETESLFNCGLNMESVKNLMIKIENYPHPELDENHSYFTAEQIYNDGKLAPCFSTDMFSILDAYVSREKIKNIDILLQKGSLVLNHPEIIRLFCVYQHACFLFWFCRISSDKDFEQLLYATAAKLDYISHVIDNDNTVSRILPWDSPEYFEFIVIIS
jgi:hypothetical protein